MGPGAVACRIVASEPNPPAFELLDFRIRDWRQPAEQSFEPSRLVTSGRVYDVDEVLASHPAAEILQEQIERGFLPVCIDR